MPIEIRMPRPAPEIEEADLVAWLVEPGAEIALGDHVAVVAVIDAVGAVIGFRDDRAEGRAFEGQVHLVADLDQPVLDHRQGDRIDIARAHVRCFLASILPHPHLTLPLRGPLPLRPQGQREDARRPQLFLPLLPQGGERVGVRWGSPNSSTRNALMRSPSR